MVTHRQEALAALAEFLGGTPLAQDWPWRFSLQDALLTRASRGLQDGLAALASEPCATLFAERSRPDLSGEVLAVDVATRAGLQGDERLAWVAIAYWIRVSEWYAVRDLLEALTERDLYNLVWLVAGAMWVQWSSGQLTSVDLRQTLLRVREKNPTGFDEFLVLASQDPRLEVCEAARVICTVSGDAHATLETVP